MLDLPERDLDTIETGLMLLREIASELTLRAAAMETERGVVLSEERWRDTPKFRAYAARLGLLLEGQLTSDWQSGGLAKRLRPPVDLLKAQVKRIEALNSKVNCITYEHFDEALKEAKQSEDRYRRGDARPLEGITVAIKDDFSRAGWKTTQGSLIFKDSPPATENVAVVDSLEAAGVVFPFQTTVPEF